MNRLYRRYGKRCTDLTFAVFLMALLTPLLAVLWLAIRVFLGGPAIFAQLRPGRGGRGFMLYKFRTMTNACDASGKLLPDEVRLTTFGRLLRSTSLDELPELWNVIRGDMSLVGPRPLLMEYLDKYSPREARRHEVRPGITGWAQVNGRNAIRFTERFNLDVWYVEHCSLALDLRIVAMTVQRVFSRDGITQPGRDEVLTRYDQRGAS